MIAAVKHLLWHLRHPNSLEQDADDYAFMVSIGGLCVAWREAADEDEEYRIEASRAYRACADQLAGMIETRKAQQ